MIYGSIDGLAKPLPRVVFGAMPLVEPDEKTFALLDDVVAQGCYALDTAHDYGEGASEKVLGAWMAARGNRKELLIIDKGAHPAGDVQRVDPKSIREDLARSLERLQTDYIDMYLLHRDNPALPVGPIIDVLNELREAGKIRLFGASNWAHDRIVTAQRYAEENKMQGFSLSSNQFSLAVQYDYPQPGTLSVNEYGDQSEMAWYTETQFPLLSWSSLARGFFSGKFTSENLDDFGDRQSLLSIASYATEENFVRLDRAKELAVEKGATVPQIALSYVLHQPLNGFAITGSLNIAHFKESVAALDITLSEQEQAWLNLKIDDRS
jgi:aryl-alcohol dehydrogenase-like predicted oxidoreductase